MKKTLKKVISKYIVNNIVVREKLRDALFPSHCDTPQLYAAS